MDIGENSVPAPTDPGPGNASDLDPRLSRILHRALSVDLEVHPERKVILAIGAVCGEASYGWKGPRGNPTEALSGLDRLAEGADLLLGHNIIDHDLCYLRKARPGLRLLQLPVVDTLRLNPLAFPAHPYHNLVKHYRNPDIVREQRNDPELDSRLTREVLADQMRKLPRADGDLLTAWHRLCTPDPTDKDRALNRLFATIRGAVRPSDASASIERFLKDRACPARCREILDEETGTGWELAYSLAWISVAGGNSVMPPWVRHRFPEAGKLVRRLRDRSCGSGTCSWCAERHDALKELKRWFGHDAFRPQPEASRGRSMQRTIVEKVMEGASVIGILPTGTGKSLCYQLPALSLHHKTGALTVVVSPLVALMADQIKGMEKNGIHCAATINSLLTMPERTRYLEDIRLGTTGILLTSPESLRSPSLRKAIEQREVGLWVLDEAHCLSRWGHDFRPDYRYVTRFIGQSTGEDSPSPVLCLTATAKPDVIEEITDHFRARLGTEPILFNGGAERTNLTFEVLPTSRQEKFSAILAALDSGLPVGRKGGAIIYCATRRHCEEVAEHLRSRDREAEHFHAGLPPEEKKEVQQRFVEGELQVISATNAFGMGIDKHDVRLVVHADIPGSLENYLQEAGRSGRDGDPAHCVLLYQRKDVEKQFHLSSRSRLTRESIQAVLKALRRMDRYKRRNGEVVATEGEILREDEEREFPRNPHTEDNRVRTAVAWLEEAELATRKENRVCVFPSSLRVDSVDEARRRLERKGLKGSRIDLLLRIVGALIDSPPDRGISTDELMEIAELGPEGVRTALHDLESCGIANNDTVITAHVHTGGKNPSLRRFEQAEAMEKALIAHMRELAEEGNGFLHLHLRIASQRIRDQGLPDARPETIWLLIRGLANDGRSSDENNKPSLKTGKPNREMVRLTPERSWDSLERTARMRRRGARHLLDHLLECVDRKERREKDVLAETTMGRLMQALLVEKTFEETIRKPDRLLHYALLWLHDLEVIRLGRGLLVFRPAMTIQLPEDRKRQFATDDYKPLEDHYLKRTVRIHVMEEYAQRGLKDARQAQRLAEDYFRLTDKEFLDLWLKDRKREIRRQTTPDSWKRIVEDLGNAQQRNIVTDDRKRTNVLVLAGPGSGKTHALVHRIAYLVQVLREDPRGIIALVYNRHAAVEIRHRLEKLIEDRAHGVTVLTCHALAMRLTGSSFSELEGKPDEDRFGMVLRDAIGLLAGSDLPPEEADENRDRLLAGFRWILVDEYQDIGPDEYELISALAGRTLDDSNGRINLLAVGDDDQNIYSFKGSSVEFIRRFEQDYKSRPLYLTANYRSTCHIIDASNALIQPARDRMKVEYPIHINPERMGEDPGGLWNERDPVSRGKVQILPAGRDAGEQARAVMAEMQRIASIPTDWNWSRSAVIARHWKMLHPLQAICEAEGIRAVRADEEIPRFWRLREVRMLDRWLCRDANRPIGSDQLREWIAGQASNRWIELLEQAVDEFELEQSGAKTPSGQFREWLAEWGAKGCRRLQRGLLLCTAHRAKGLEFDHVVVLDGRWTIAREDPDEGRRLYYVAMTRARHTLTLARMEGSRGFVNELAGLNSCIRRQTAELPAGEPQLSWRHEQATLKEVNISFAGRFPPGDRIHRRIRALTVGSPLDLRRGSGGAWELRDAHGCVVGRMARAFAPPEGMHCRSASVHAVVEWSKAISGPEYRDRCHCEHWEVVIPELVFEPGTPILPTDRSR